MSETRSVLTVWNVESPLRNVEELAVPDPNLAVGTVPDAKFPAFKLVKLAPLPLNVPVVNVLLEGLNTMPDVSALSVFAEPEVSTKVRANEESVLVFVISIVSALVALPVTLPTKLDAVTIPIESTFPLDDIVIPVSYTHLTLPTILLV